MSVSKAKKLLHTRPLNFLVGLCFSILYILFFLYATKFFIYAVDNKIYSYFLYSKLQHKNPQELKQLVNDYSIINYRVTVFALISFLFVCCVTLFFQRKSITRAIIAILVTGSLAYLDILEIRRPGFIGAFSLSWFSNFRLYLILNGFAFLGLSICLYLFVNKYLTPSSKLSTSWCATNVKIPSLRQRP